jgi:hypothetical protein
MGPRFSARGTLFASASGFSATSLAIAATGFHFDFTVLW